MRSTIICLLLLLVVAVHFVYAQADLSLTKSDTEDPVVLGTNVNYVVIVTNNGPSTANNVVVTDALTSSSTFQSIASPEEWQCTAPQAGTTGTVSCTTQHLQANQSATFTIVVKPTAAGMLTNTANATSEVNDPNTENNSDSEQTTVLATPPPKEKKN